MRQVASSDPTEVKRRLLSAFVRFLTPGSWTLLARLRAGAVVALLVLAEAGILSQPGVAPKSVVGSVGSTPWVGLPGRSPAGDSHWEAYTQARPDVLTPAGELSVTPRAHPKLGSDWPRLRDAHLEAVAQMLELYPNEPLYFLARDSELLYDAARFLLREEPAALARLHLLNISRGNMRAPHVLEYLAQEGISAESLRAGLRPVFIDTGFSGTIPRVVAEQFPADVRGFLRTHLLSSSNSAHPSSRVFLTGLNPAAPSMAPSSLTGSMVSYEYMPRMTDRSTRFERVNGRWEAMSPRGTSGSDGTVSAALGLAYREDLLAHLSTPAVRTHFTARRRIWRALRSQALNPGLTPEQRVTAYRRYLAHGAPSERAFREAAVRDVLEWGTTTRRVPGASTALPALPMPQSLGLSSVVAGESRGSNKNEIIAQYPQWAAILEDPNARIPALLAAGDYTTLGAILDVIQDDEIFRIAATSLDTQNPPSPQTVGLVEALIGKGNAHVQGYIAYYVLSQAHWTDHPELVRALIETGNEPVRSSVAVSILSEAHWSNHPELVRALIETGDADVQMSVAKYILSEVHWSNHPELVRALIETGDADVQVIVAKYVLNQTHLANHPELVRALIESGNAKVQYRVAESVLSQAHWANHPELVRTLIQTDNAGVRSSVAQFVLSQAHWANHPELVRALIETGNSGVRLSFESVHDPWSGHPDFIASVSSSVAQFVLNQARWANHPHFEVWRSANAMADLTARRAFLLERLGPPTASSAGCEGGPQLQQVLGVLTSGGT